ncbi:MAG: hypothetical protein KAJ63_01380, partial [Methyloprofundus sp.]|nr:hypothetical protein [Methyloprofundus sp.]
AIILSRCKSVIVRNLTMHSHQVGSNANTKYEHLNGVLTVRDVEGVTVESVSLSCVAGGKKMASCLTVAHTTQTSSLRIRSCHLNPGHQQVGVLVVNANRARIEDNVIRVRPNSNKSSLKKRLNDKAYRLTIRKMILSDVVVVEEKAQPDEKRKFEFNYEKKILRFHTPDSLINAWQDFFDKNSPKANLSNRDLIRYVKTVTDKMLLTLAARDRINPITETNKFKDWFEGVKSHLPAIASQGIVCGGRVANDICITKNSIHGVAQGIHIGLSHSDAINKEADHAGRLLIEGNKIVNYLSSQVLGGWHGVFIGNVECLHIENNHLELQKYPYTLKSSVNGIRVYGYFGDMMQIRGNRVAGYDTGILAKALNLSRQELCLWQVENNLLRGASPGFVLMPRRKFIASNNIS